MRALVVAVVVALLSAPGSAVVRHVHAAGEDAHADHQHGPSAHLHLHDASAPAAGTHDGQPAVASRVPGDHAVSIPAVGLSPHRDPAPDCVVVETVAAVPQHHGLAVMSRDEVRSHGPPRRTATPVRAPPLVHPA